MADARVALAGALLALVLLELAWARRHMPRAYDLRETCCNLIILMGNSLLRPISLAWLYTLLAVLEPLRIVELPFTFWVFAASFIVTEFAYYWYHRWSHEVPALWALHHVHHSSATFNLTTAVRLSWIGKFIAPLYFAPLSLLGLPAEFVVLSLAIGLAYQFPLHTQAIERLGWFEGRLLNTPSAHRVHHGINPQYVDRNYGAVLIVWDVLFGTYAPEDSTVRFGVPGRSVGGNPLAVQFQPLVWLLQARDNATAGNAPGEDGRTASRAESG